MEAWGFFVSEGTRAHGTVAAGYVHNAGSPDCLDREVFLIHVYCGASLGHGKRTCAIQHEVSASSLLGRFALNRSGCPCRHYLLGGPSWQKMGAAFDVGRRPAELFRILDGDTRTQAAREQFGCRSAAVRYLVSSWSRDSLVDYSTNTTAQALA